MKIMMVLGGRPQFIKSAPVIHELIKRNDVKLQLIDSGQHYDYELSKLLFEEMQLPAPAVNLKVGSGSHASQTGKIMIALERCIIRARPDIILVPGDTNTTLGAALASVKLHVPVGHIEAGARSYDMSMPEEINRRVTDHVSSLLFAPTRTTVRNLSLEGIPSRHVFLVGDTLVDALKTALPKALGLRSKLLAAMDIREREFVLVTAHRPANVDNPERLAQIVNSLVHLSKHMRVLFPAHPRVIFHLKATRLLGKLRACKNIVVTKPFGYLELVALLDAANVALTDSGGLQKEAFLLGVPCVTMRTTTEWPETIRTGANVLVDVETSKIVKAVLVSRKSRRTKKPLCSSSNPFGDGKASERIVKKVLESA